MTTPYLSLIIPAYNEEKRILQTLAIAYAYLTERPFTWEVVVVLDGSTDSTKGVIDMFIDEAVITADQAKFQVIDRPQNRGKGYTVREGMLKASGAIRLFSDADNSTDIAHFDLMRPLFETGHDVVICTRDSKDVQGAMQATPQPFIKRLFGNLGNLFIQLVAVPGIWDTQCGFKAFSAEAAQAVFSKTQIDRWAIDIEALAIARQHKYKIGLVPAHWIDADGTHVKSSDYIVTLLETVKIRWRLLTGTYR